MKKPRNNNFQEITLGQITGLHTHTQKLIRQNTGLMPFSTPPKQDIPKEVFDTLGYINPLVIKNISGKLYVVGNLRLYQLLVENMSADYLVLYQEISNRRTTEIEKLFWAEQLIQPILYNRNKPNLNWLYQSWQRFEQGFFALWAEKPFRKIKTKKDFATTINTDVRNLDK